MDADNQQNYWNRVAEEKTFSHPVDIPLLEKYLSHTSSIIDYGCGYGRIVKTLMEANFSNVTGYDTSMNLISRGNKNNLPIHIIPSPADLPLENKTIDCILLFAVLTCIPSNKGQQELITLLRSKLKPGGLLYISDYYLQDNEVSRSRYTAYNSDPTNFGVFHLPEGALFRHHTKEWVAGLLGDFHIIQEQPVAVKTMNGNNAEAFQLIASKPIQKA